MIPNWVVVSDKDLRSRALTILTYFRSESLKCVKCVNLIQVMKLEQLQTTTCIKIK